MAAWHPVLNASGALLVCAGRHAENYALLFLTPAMVTGLAVGGTLAALLQLGRPAVR